jgi:hypothetical protein
MRNTQSKDLFESDFVVYGTGAVSARFNLIIEKRKAYNHLVGYAVTKKTSAVQIFNGKHVEQVESYPKGIKIAVAVHISLWGEIKKHLEKLGYYNYVWIYPELFDLYYGVPLQENIMINVRSIVANLYPIYTHVIYYLAIENYFGMNDVGYDFYIKYMKMHCSNETAYCRLQNFREKIAECEEKGFCQEFNIKLIAEGHIILDGAHRLMLAYYFGKENIYCDLYEGNMEAYLNFSGEIALNDEHLEKQFLPKEVALIRERYDRWSIKGTVL